MKRRTKSCRRWRVAAVVPALLCAAQPVAAEPGTVTLSTANWVEHIENYADPDEDFYISGIGGRDDDARLVTDNNVLFVYDLDRQQTFRFQQRVRYESYLRRTDLNALFVTPRLEYWYRFTPMLQGRVRYDYTYRLRGDEERYHRHRTETQLRYRPSRTFNTVARTGVGYWDYNDDEIVGWDRLEAWFGLEQYWHPFDDRTYLGLGGEYTRISSDQDRYSYDQYEVALLTRTEITSTTDLLVRARYFERDYQGPFNAATPFHREDQRVEVSMTLRQRVGGLFTLFGDASWRRNWSNIPINDYTGFEAGGGFMMEY